MAERMKDSGNRWIGEIPESWNTKKIKYLANLKGRIGWQGLTSDEYQDEGAFLITGTDFDNGKINWDTCVHVPMKRWEEAKEIQIQNGDLLITKDGTVGKVAIVSDIQGETSLNSGVLRIMTNEGYNRRFLFWVLQSDVFWNWFNYKNAGNSTIVHLYQGDFAEFMYAFPAEKEQRAIADFLDKRCAQIDDVIADLEKQINLLEKYKVSLVNETVHYGINKNRMMKETKIDWIGKIPCSWEINKLGYLGTLQNGISKGAEYFGSGFPFVSYGNVYNNMALPDNIDGLVESTLGERIQYSVKQDDIFFTRTSETVEEIGFSSVCESTIENATFAGFLIRFRPDNDVLTTGYAKYYFRANMLRAYFVKEMMIVTRASLGQYLLKEVPVLLPPIKEQQQISSYLDYRCQEIEDIIKSKQNQRLKMLETRKSLIYEYVTGKNE